MPKKHTSLDVILRKSTAPGRRRCRHRRRSHTPAATAHRSLALRPTSTSSHAQHATAATATHQIVRLVQQTVRRAARTAVRRAAAQHRLASCHRTRALRPQIGQRAAHNPRSRLSAAGAGQRGGSRRTAGAARATRRTWLLERHTRRIVHALRAAQAHRLRTAAAAAAAAVAPSTAAVVMVMMMRRMRVQRRMMVMMQLMGMVQLMMVAGSTERRAARHRWHAARARRLVQLAGAAGGRRVTRAQRVAAATRVGRVVPAVAAGAGAGAGRIAGVVRLRRLLGGIVGVGAAAARVRVVRVAVADRPLGDARRRLQAGAGRHAANGDWRTMLVNGHVTHKCSTEY